MFSSNRVLPSLRRTGVWREFLTGLLLATQLLLPIQAAAPSWWETRGVIIPGKANDDFAVINQGQLKYLVSAVVAEMNAKLTDGAGPSLNALVNAWTTSTAGADDFAVVNVGQLKTVTKAVYQRLLAAGAIEALPAWATDNSNDDFAVANIGQAKHLFAFEVPDQVSMLVMQALHVQQSMAIEQTSPNGLVVWLERNGAPVPNETVTFEIFQSLGGLVAVNDTNATPQPTFSLVSDANGYASCQFRAPAESAYSWVRATATGAAPQWFLMTVAGGSGSFPSNPPGITGVDFVQDPSLVDSDEDGVPDSEDMVSYDPSFKTARSMGAGTGGRKYAVIDMGMGYLNGTYNSAMGSSGTMVWQGETADTWRAWSPTTGQTVDFTKAGIISLSGLIDLSITDIGHDGRLCGQGKSVEVIGGANVYVPRVFVYDPFAGSCQVFPISPKFYNYSWYNQYGNIEWGVGGNPTAVVQYQQNDIIFRQLILLTATGEVLIKEVQKFERPPVQTYPEGSSFPVSVPAGLGKEQDLVPGVSSVTSLIYSDRVVQGQVEDYYIDGENGVVWSPRFLVESNQWSYRLLTSAGQSLTLGTRDVLTESLMSFTGVSTHTPLPWIVASGMQAKPLGQYENPDHLWVPGAEGYESYRIYGSAEQYALEQPLDFIESVNGEGMAWVHGYMSDGTNDYGVWANGEATSLPAMIGQEVMDQYYSWTWVFHGLSDQGTIAMSAYSVEDDADHILMLVPVEVDSLTREISTGEISYLGGAIAESLPIPEVDLTINEAEINGDNLNISVTCKVCDPLSELPGVTPLNQVQFFVNGNLTETIDNLNEQATESPIPIWQARSSAVEMQRTFTIPLSGGVQIVSVQTGDNAAGNHGFAAAYVVISKHLPPPQTVSTSLMPSIWLNDSLSIDTTDAITLQFPGQSPTVLTEMDPTASYFTDTVLVKGSSEMVTVRIKSGETLSSTSVDSFGAMVIIGTENPAYYEGWWHETGMDTGTFTCTEFHPSGDAPGLLYVAAIQESNLGAAGFVQPFVTRLKVPPAFRSLVSANGPYKLTLNGEEVPLVEKPGFIPGDDHPDYLYLAENGNPRLFTAREELEGTSLAPDGLITNQQFEVELRRRDDDRVIFKQDHTITSAPPVFQHLDDGSNTEPPPQASDPAPLSLAEFQEQMLIAYVIGFGEYGERLYNEAKDIGVTLRYGYLLGDFDNWDIDDYLQGAYNEGKRPIITLDRTDLKTPARAAQALFDALHHLFSRYFTAIEIQQRTPPFTPSPYLSPEDAAIELELSQGRYDRIAQGLGDVTFAMEMGISLAFPETGVILSVAHIADAWRDGESVSAYSQAALLMLPYVGRFAIRTGRPLVVKLGRIVNDVEFVIPPTASQELIRALQTIGKGDRVAAMRQLRPLIENGEVSVEWVELWYKAGWLKFPVKKKAVEGVVNGDPYKILTKEILQREGLSAKPANTITHHDLALGTHSVNGVDVDLTLEFLKRGIDPNDGMIAGRFLDTELHRLIHGNIRGLKKSQWGDGNGGGGPFNYQWWKFFDDNKDATASEVLSFVNDLVEATSDFTTRTFDDIAWPYPNPLL